MIRISRHQIFSADSVTAIGFVFMAINAPNKRIAELQSWAIDNRSLKIQAERTIAPIGQIS